MTLPEFEDTSKNDSSEDFKSDESYYDEVEDMNTLPLNDLELQDDEFTKKIKIKSKKS
jgi:hypothetical protein